jgi:hypothetical protein
MSVKTVLIELVGHHDQNLALMVLIVHFILVRIIVVSLIFRLWVGYFYVI